MQSTAPVATAARAESDNPGGFTHVPALDGVRGVAIVLVLCTHLFDANNHTGLRVFDALLAVLGSGYIGLNLFFVLSGFLITGILMDTLHLPNFFKVFYARRILRIFPLYYGVLVLLLILTRRFHLQWDMSWKIRLLTYTGNLFFWRASQFVPVTPFNINHFWSLQVEEQFYLLWPLLVYRMKRPGRLIGVALAGCAAALLFRVVVVSLRPHVQNIYLPYSFTLSCADNLLYGCCLAALLRTAARTQVLRMAPRVFWVAAALLVLLGLRYDGLEWQMNNVVPTIGFTIVGIGSAALVAMTLRTGSAAQRLLSAPVLRFFGRYSYGLYVFHYSLSALSTPIRRTVDLHLHSKALGVLASASVELALSIVLALLSYHLYEAYFLKLKRYFPYSGQPRSAM